MLKNQWLQDRLDARDETQSALARAIGVQPGKINLLIRGAWGMKPHHIAKAAKFLGYTEAELISLLSGEPLPPPSPPDKGLDPFTAAVVAVEAFAQDSPLSPERKAALIQRINAALRPKPE
jgi:hypothetical protein